jgi:hypothetical protein
VPKTVGHPRSAPGKIARHLDLSKLARLCRYIARPAVSNERIELTECGHVKYTLKTPYRDGTTHVYFSPMDFLASLADLVPKPRVNLMRFHGVLAPNRRVQGEVVKSMRGRRMNPAGWKATGRLFFLSIVGAGRPHGRTTGKGTLAVKRLSLALCALSAFVLAPLDGAASQQRDLNDPYRLAWLASYCRTESAWAGDPGKGLDVSQQEKQWQQLFEAGLFWSALYDRSLRNLSSDAATPPPGFGSCTDELPRVLREFRTLDEAYGRGWQTGWKTAKSPPPRAARNEALYEARWCEAVSKAHLGLMSAENEDRAYRRNVSDILQWWSRRAASLSRPAGTGGLTGAEVAMLAQVEQHVREDFEEVKRILGPTPQRKTVWPRFIASESSRHCGSALSALSVTGG